MGSWQIGVTANLVVAVAYLAIFWSIISPLLRARAEGLNLLGVATAGIFLTCAFHHAGHALVTLTADHAHTDSGFFVALVAWDVVTMAVGVYYWTLRRSYGQFAQGGQLFADLQAQRQQAAEEAALRRVATAVAEEHPPEVLSQIAEREIASLAGDLSPAEAERCAARFDALIGLGAANARADAARRDAEAALATERDHAASIVAALRDGLVVMSPEGEILEVNEPFLEMVGLDRSEVVGLTGPPFPWLVPGDEEPLRALARVREDGRGLFEISYVRDGAAFPVQVSVAARRGPGGEDLGFVATSRDLGPMRQAEEELRRGEAAQRESEALLAAEREAQRLKDEFLAMVSHELRTPLSAVVGYLELAIADTGDPDVRGLLEVAERNGRRLSALVRDILLVAQADAGRLGLDLRPMELGDLVSQAVRDALPSAGAKRITLEGEVGANPLIDGDPGRLSQVLDNLIANAIKFSPDGSRVTVRLEVRSGSALITVADDGPGIPADERARLFEPFFRARQATKDVVPGSGLGLAVVKAIAEAHGGSVGLESRVGHGSAFRTVLPLRRVGAEIGVTA